MVSDTHVTRVTLTSSPPVPRRRVDVSEAFYEIGEALAGLKRREIDCEVFASQVTARLNPTRSAQGPTPGFVHRQ